jgi:hypothetical protein
MFLRISSKVLEIPGVVVFDPHRPYQQLLPSYEPRIAVKAVI